MRKNCTASARANVKFYIVHLVSTICFPLNGLMKSCCTKDSYTEHDWSKYNAQVCVNDFVVQSLKNIFVITNQRSR